MALWIQASWEGMSYQRIVRNTWRRVCIPQPLDAPINDVHISANEDIPTGIHQIEDVVPVQGKCTCSLDEEIDLLYYNDSGDLQLPVQQNRTIF